MIKKEHWQWLADYESGVRGSPIPSYKEDHLNLNRNTDMNISELSVSKYLKKEDCDPPIRVTIVKIEQENMAKDNEAPELKFVLHFNECKPLVLNKTNGNRIALVLKSPETDDWTGKQIDLWSDPTVEYGGEIKGGVRVLIPQPSVAQPQSPQFVDSDLDDMPNF